jgi:hypothetical protein
MSRKTTIASRPATFQFLLLSEVEVFVFMMSLLSLSDSPETRGFLPPRTLRALRKP